MRVRLAKLDCSASSRGRVNKPAVPEWTVVSIHAEPEDGTVVVASNRDRELTRHAVAAARGV